MTKRFYGKKAISQKYKYNPTLAALKLNKDKQILPKH